jgi:hypothetical protein
VATINQPEDLVAALIAAPENADSLRLTQLQRFFDLNAAEHTGLQLEQTRLEAKYGEGSPQAVAAAARLAGLNRERASIDAELARASMPVPASSADRFIIFGRVLSLTGEVVGGVKVAAVDAAGNQLAAVAVGDRGAFALPVPVTKPSTIGTPDHPPATQPTGPFHLQVFGPKELLVFKGEEEFDAVGDRIAYREIIVSKSARPT